MSNFKIFKLKFDRVHFGNGILEDGSINFSANTLFSAMCIEVLNIHGKNGYESFLSFACDTNFAMSDAMVYIDFVEKGVIDEKKVKQSFYIPKPIVKIERKKADGKEFEDKEGRKNAKKSKKINWIDANELSEFLQETANLDSFEMPKFVGKTVETKVAVPRSSEDNKGEANPYRIETHSFANHYYLDSKNTTFNAGLYVIVNIDKQKYPHDLASFEQILRLVGLNGLGGKRSAGLGKFSVCESEFDDCFNGDFFNMLTLPENSEFKGGKTPDNKPKYVLLTTATFNEKTFNENEFNNDVNIISDNDCYLIKKQTGFTYSLSQKEQMRKKDCYMFRPGSAFVTPFNGAIFDVRPDGFKHRVDLFSKPIFLKLPQEQ